LLRRLSEDSLRVLPWRDPLADGGAWRAAKAAAAPAFRRAQQAFELAEATQQLDGVPVEWDVLMHQARCARKAGEPPANWLAAMARGAAAAAAADPAAGGVLMPLYALHAARARLLLGLPAARAWCGGGGSGGGSGGTPPASAEEVHTLRLVGSYCFLPGSHAALSGAAGPPSRGLAADPTSAVRVLLADCVAAMRWCLEREPGFHRAAHRRVPGGGAPAVSRFLSAARASLARALGGQQARASAWAPPQRRRRAQPIAACCRTCSTKASSC
jgi:hypothetical protein